MSTIVRKINSIANVMSTIDRYSQIKLINPESVLEHTGYVCFCSLTIANKLILEGEEINIGGLLSRATLHDVEEIVIGDIAAPTKYWSPKVTSTIKNIETEAAFAVLSNLDPTKTLFSIWASAKLGKEGFIVALADKLAVVYKVSQEINGYSNHTLKEHIHGLIPALEKFYESDNICVIDNKHIIVDILDEAIEICTKIN